GRACLPRRSLLDTPKSAFGRRRLAKPGRARRSLLDAPKSAFGRRRLAKAGAGHPRLSFAALLNPHGEEAQSAVSNHEGPSAASTSYIKGSPSRRAAPGVALS